MTKLIVVEARRLLPIAVLFIMLVAVSVYDGLTSPSVPAATQPNAVPYRTVLETAQAKELQSTVVTSLDMWVAMHEALGVPLTDYDFQPDKEIAVFLLNCRLRSTREREGIIELTVASRTQAVQLVVFDRANLTAEGTPDFILIEQDN